MFRKTHLFAEKSSALQAASTTVIPFKSEQTDYAEYGVTLSVALNAEIRKPVDREKMAIGMALLMRRSGGVWIAEAEVGWTGRDVGWDSFASREVQSSSVEQLIEEVPALIAWMDETFREEVERLSA
jgi:hypothetical protein